jgi:hypothetical protein
MARRKPLKPEHLNSPQGMDLEPEPKDIARFMRFVQKLDNGCWLWQGGKDDKGYGQFWLMGTVKWAHRVAYAFFRRPLVGGLTLDHKCLCTSCVNPWHLEPKHNGDNAAEGNRNRAKPRDEEVPF